MPQKCPAEFQTAEKKSHYGKHRLSAEGKTVRKQLEIDFIANKGNKKYYIQSAYEMSTEEKVKQGKKSLNKLNDSFKKFVIVKDDIKTEIDEDGLISMGIFEFLLNENSLDV